MIPEPPKISTIDRKLAWSRLARELFGESDREVACDGYRLTEVLGRGAMGTVYLAHDSTLEREVAIKLVEGGDPAAVLREARALARVAHPSVVAIHHVGELEGSVYIVMERLRGIDLRAWQAQPRPWLEIVRLYVELARGLAEAHRLGVVHRDFKPDNVRVDEQGRARILDFGLAGPIDAEPSGGTPAYVAPEQLAGAPADPRMDQYAWAVALHEALLGERPRTSELPEHPAGPDTPPPRVHAVIARALDRDPARRWPSMDALSDALERAATTSAEQRARELLLDQLRATWLAGPLAQVRREGSVELHPPIVSRTSSHPGRAVELELIDHALARGGSVLVLGEPGSGKTTLLLELAALALARARRDPSALLPVVLNLSSWSSWPSSSLAGWLIDALRIEYGIPASVARHWLEHGSLLLLLDGLDEVALTRRAACVAAIEALRAEHLVGVAVGCRSGDYRQLSAGLQPALVVELQPLPVAALRSALERAGQPELAAMLARSPMLAELVTTPLTVDVMLRYAHEPSPELLESRNPEAFLRALLARLVEHQLAALDLDRRAWLHARLARLAALLERKGVSELWLERIQPSWLASAGARAVHGVASLLVAATMLALVVALTLVPAAGVHVGLSSAGLAGPLLAIFVGASVGLRRIDPVERLAWSWSRMRGSLRRALARALIMAAAVSAIATFVWGIGQPLAFVVQVAISNLVVYSLLFAMMLALLGGLGAELVATRSRINEGMRASARNMLLVWLLVTSMLALPLLALATAAGSLAAPPLHDSTAVWQASPARFFTLVALCMASTLGLVAGLLRGGFALVQHAMLRVMLALGGELPLRVSRLLEAGCAASLLRRIGGGHSFPHAAIQAELARQHELPISYTER